MFVVAYEITTLREKLSAREAESAKLLQRTPQAPLRSNPTPTPIQSSTPTPTPIPTPEPTPSAPPFSIKQTGNSDIYGSTWTIILPAGKWYNTGLPVTAETHLSMGAGPPFFAKVGGRMYWSGEAMGGQQVVNETFGDKYGNTIVPPDFFDTVKLKVNDDGGEEWIQITLHLDLRHQCSGRTFDDFHTQIHDNAKRRAEALLERISRKG